MSDDKTVESGAAASGEGKDSDDLTSLVKDYEDRSGNKSAKKESAEGFGVASEYLADKAISAVKGNLDVPDTFVRRHLLGQLNDDQEFQEAWFGQLEDRGRWEKALARVTEEFQGLMKPKEPENKGAQDNDKVAAAARSAREIKQPAGHTLDDVNWAELSTSEFEAKKQEVFRRAAAGTL